MAIQYGLFFTRDETVLRLPVNPEKLPVEKDGENEDYNVLGIGPITVPRTPKGREVKISSFFPGRPAPYVLTTGGFRAPEFYIEFFSKAMDDGEPILYTPVRYYENGEPFMAGDTGFLVLVSDFSYEERGAETGDFYYDLTLTEYRDYSPQTLQIETPETPEEPPEAKVEPTRPIPPKEIYIGATVMVNGNYYYSSYGDEPHGTANDRRCKVSHMVTSDPQRAYPIHITTESGGWLGWAKKEAMQVVSQ